VTAIGFSMNKTYLAASDAAEKIAVHVYRVADKGTKAFATVEINMKVAHLAWAPCDENLFATAGAKHMMVCALTKDKFKATRGKNKGGDSESMCSAAFSNQAEYANHLFTGGSDGKVYHW